jgi:DNA modification methylase
VTPYYSDPWLTVYEGDCRAVLAALPAESVHTVVTSPPYWGLRDYGSAGQLGLEPTPEEYVANMVAVFREVRRVLGADGTLWLNLGDSYAGRGKGPSNDGSKQRTNVGSLIPGTRNPAQFAGGQAPTEWLPVPAGLKPKDLVGIPWRVAFALQADGWYLRSDIIWAKPNPMPESVTDRPTKAHEYLFLLSKSARYYYDADAVREVYISGPTVAEPVVVDPKGTGHRARHTGHVGRGGSHATAEAYRHGGRNLRSVWTVATQPYPGAHFATFPPKLIEPAIKAGCPELGTVLDPFAGSGTTGMVAQSLSRRAVLIDLNGEYLTQAMARNRDIPLGLDVA